VLIVNERYEYDDAIEEKNKPGPTVCLARFAAFLIWRIYIEHVTDCNTSCKL
jgi:hypothetical protein